MSIKKPYPYQLRKNKNNYCYSNLNSDRSRKYLFKFIKSPLPNSNVIKRLMALEIERDKIENIAITQPTTLYIP